MRKTRTIVAVTLLATALCADRAVARAATQASPRTEAGPVARSFAERLTVSLRRVVPAVRLHQGRQEAFAAVAWQGGLGDYRAPLATHDAEGSPFQFRLPPPLV
jgi:hypothetical protein